MAATNRRNCTTRTKARADHQVDQRHQYRQSRDAGRPHERQGVHSANLGAAADPRSGSQHLLADKLRDGAPYHRLGDGPPTDPLEQFSTRRPPRRRSTFVSYLERKMMTAYIGMRLRHGRSRYGCATQRKATTTATTASPTGDYGALIGRLILASARRWSGCCAPPSPI